MLKIEVKNQNIAKMLEKSIKEAKKKEVAIGVLKGSGNYESGETLAEVATTHEYGSITKNIPARSFLRVPFYQNQKRVDRIIGLAYKSLVKNTATLDKALNVIGAECRNISVDAFDDGAGGTWAENKKSTINAKGSSKPLIDTGKLRQSIQWEVRYAT